MQGAREIAGMIHGLIQHDLDKAIERFATPPRAETAALHFRIMSAAKRNGCRPWLWAHNQGPFIRELLSIGSESRFGSWVRFEGDGDLIFDWRRK